MFVNSLATAPSQPLSSKTPDPADPTRQILSQSSFVASSSPHKMLRVYAMSGTELAVVATEEVEDVAALKLRLREMHGFPVCLQELLVSSRVPSP